MFFKVFVVVAAMIVVNYAAETCPDIPQHYIELGCKAVKDKESDPCPSHFTCPKWQSLERDKCNYKSRAYAVGDDVSDTLPTCTATCKCQEAQGTAYFQCAFNECPEGSEKPVDGCVNQYTIESCCSTSRVCGEQVKKLPECWVEGKEYRGGQLIYPKSAPCYKCLCGDGFDNSTAIASNSNCQRVDCGIELHQLGFFMDGCVPVYFNDDFCCPIEFRCPNVKDAAIPNEARTAGDNNPNSKCSYGSLTLSKGEKVQIEEKCLECSCKDPPVVQCTRTINTAECQ